MTSKVSESRFFMWRALFAMAHADAVVSPEERNFMHRVLDEEGFTDAQRETLKHDIEQKQDVRAMFAHITDQQDRSAFFHHARSMVWADGNFDGDEQAILLELKKLHVQSVDFETFEIEQGLELDEAQYTPSAQSAIKQRDGLIARILRALSGH